MRPKKKSRWNDKQCRPWSDCSSRSSLIWVYTVCPDLDVWKLRNITVYLLQFVSNELSCQGDCLGELWQMNKWTDEWTNKGKESWESVSRDVKYIIFYVHNTNVAVPIKNSPIKMYTIYNLSQGTAKSTWCAHSKDSDQLEQLSLSASKDWTDKPSLGACLRVCCVPVPAKVYSGLWELGKRVDRYQRNR